MHTAEFVSRHRSVMARLNHAYATADAASFESLINDLYLQKEHTLRTGLAKLSQALADALARFQLDSRIAALAAKEIPDARQRLDHVLKMTEDATHRTLDLIEQTVPLAESTANDALTLANTLDERSHREIRLFLSDVQGSAERVRANLTEVMLAQGFQDLTGQILHGIRTLIVEVESVLDELAKISGVELKPPVRDEAGMLHGPAIPGLSTNTIANQDDVDDLIAGLGI
jgi:chemotaxis protein CheZ